jgi:hypothetical protein
VCQIIKRKFCHCHCHVLYIVSLIRCVHRWLNANPIKAANHCHDAPPFFSPTFLCLPFSPAFSFCPLHCTPHTYSVGAFSIHGCWTDTRIYISPASLLTHQCTVGPPLCSVAFFIVCVFVCCFAPLVGPPHHQHHQRFSFYPFFGNIVASRLPFSISYMHTVSSQIATVFIISSTVLQRNIRNTFSLSNSNNCVRLNKVVFLFFA